MLAQLGETPGTSPALARATQNLLDRPGSGRELVRPLGHELHLRHLVGPVRAQRGRDRPARASNAPRRRLASRHPERGRRLGRRRRELPARLCRLRAGPEHRFADRLGPPRPHGRRRGRPCGRGARHRLPVAHARRGRRLAGGALHRDRLPARLLPALSRLSEVLPALGSGALPQPHARQQPRRRRSACDPGM